MLIYSLLLAVPLPLVTQGIASEAGAEATAAAPTAGTMTAADPEFPAAESPAAESEERATPTIYDVQLNTFTESSQDNVSLGEGPDGTLVTVWHSRRQEAGTYGIRARLLDSDGEALTGEVAINETTEGMQVEPSLSVDPSGATWFAWVSRGQDGSGDGIYARRFSATLEGATAELRVADAVEGDQSEPSIVALSDGRALCVWSGPVAAKEESGQGRAIFARVLGADGTHAGPPVMLTGGAEFGYRTPAAVAFENGAMVAVAAHNQEGLPTGIFAITVDETGQGSDPMRIDGAAPGALPVEPTLSATEGRVAFAWLEAQSGDASGEYSIRWRSLMAGATEAAADAAEEATSAAAALSPIQHVDAPEPGYTSGLAVAARLDQTALFWSRYLADENGTPRLYCAYSGNSDDGEPMGEAKELLPACRATKAEAGKQAMSVGGAGQRALILEDGRIASVWHGDAGLDDKSGAHLSLLALPGSSHSPRIVARMEARAQNEESPFRGTAGPALADSPFRPLRVAGVAPAPHELPSFDPKNVAKDDGDTEVRRSILGGDIDFQGFTSTGWTPPDPEMAVGMNHIVAIVNGGIRFFDKQGTLLFNDQIEGSNGFWGSVGATGFVFDPEVVWDPHTDRFVAIAAERDGPNSYYLLAVSDDGDPNGTWAKYKLDVTPIIGNNIDSVNLSVDSQAIYLTADFFSPTRYFIYIVDKASVLNGGTPVTTNTTITGSHSMGAPVNYDANADSAYFIFAPESSTSSNIRIYAVNDPLGSPSVQSATVPVPTYGQPQDPQQMGTSSRPNLFEARFWSAVLRDDKLWATHHQGSPAVQRWYEFDLQGWPQSGQAPNLVQSGDVDTPANASTFFGSIWVDSAGTMALTCAMSSASTFISMVRTTHSAGSAPGTTQPLETIITSTSPETSGRWGDYSATNDDPAVAGRFWGHHEYREAGWRTRVASYTACNGGIDSYCTTSPNSVGSGAVITATGSTSIALNDLVLEANGAAPGVFGVFFYGDAQAAAPTGDGVRCVGGNLFRLGVSQSDLFGRFFLPLDVTMPQSPAAMITAGSTWNFQLFYRDVVPAGSGLNFSDAITVRFCD